MDPKRPNGSHEHELCWSEHYMCLIAHSGPLLQPPGPKRDFLEPRTPFRGPMFGLMQLDAVRVFYAVLDISWAPWVLRGFCSQ